MSHTDSFWKLFWTTVAIFAALYLAIVVVLIYVYDPAKTADAAAVGLIFDPSRDPFEGKRPDDSRPKFSGTYFYQDSLPLSLADWSWGTRIDWISTNTTFEGGSSFKVNFLQDWSGARMQAPDIDISQYDGISLAVYPENMDDLYIELFDQYGNSLSRQSIGWYSDSGSLTRNAWTQVKIPFENLFPEGQSKRSISGIAISTEHPGIAYVDEVHLEAEVPAHARWYEPKPPEAPVEKPDPPIALPYTLSFSPTVSSQWKTVFGTFTVSSAGIRIGTLPEKSTGSMSFIRGGQNWTDYRIDTTLFWGQTNAFSILLRYADDGNFVSCAFSHYNEVVQIYQVAHGVSTLLGTSPGLAIDTVEPWKDAKASADVQDATVSCYVNGEKVLSANIPSMPESGSAGLETWTRNTYDSPHTLEQFDVTQL